MKETFAIIGAGNGGLAFAAYLSSRGAVIKALCDKRADWLETLSRAGVLRAVGPHLRHEMPMPRLTTNPVEAAQDASVVLVVTTANAHVELARALALGVRKHQVVVLCPGYLGGAFLFRNVLRAAGCVEEPIVAELTLLPFAARVLEPGVVGIRAIKRWVLCGAIRTGQTAEVVKRLSGYLPMLGPARDTLETGLNNVNPVVHVPGTLLNLGLVDAGVFRDLDFYEVLRGRVAKVIREVDGERVALARSLGYSVPTLEEFDARSYEGVRRAYAVGGAQERWAETANVPPRYLDEDVPMGLVPLASIGRSIGRRLRVTELLIELASVVQNVDYWGTGRSLEALGAENARELAGE